MATLVIDYSELQTIASNATSLSEKAESYCSELNSDVYNTFSSVTAGVNDILSSAMYYVAAKEKSLTEKAEEYAKFAGKVCTLIDHAKQADKDVATKIENNQQDFLKKHSEINAAEGIEAFLLNLFVEVKNACPLFEIVADCYIAAFDALDSAFDALKYFYECGGGKEILQLVGAVIGVAIAVVALVACFPLSLAFTWAGVVALATVIGAGIGLANSLTNLATSAIALESRMNGDPAWARIYGKQDKLSDVLRDTNFGNGTLNRLSYGAATTLDTVEFVCDAICIADGIKGSLKTEKTDNIISDNIKKTDDEGLYKRGSFRKSTHANAKKMAPKNANGEMICPTCGEVIPEKITVMTKNGERTRVGYDLDHYPKTWAQRVEEMKKSDYQFTRKEVLDMYNKDVRVQCPKCNQSHLYEGVKGAYAN